MTPTQDGSHQAPPGLTSLFLLRLALLAVLIAATVALVSARLAEAAPASQVATAACELDLALPPGHPPVFGRGWPGGQLALPPGHPPLDGPAARFARPAPPLAPTFEAPGTLDI
jgi:hypothetical protein